MPEPFAINAGDMRFRIDVYAPPSGRDSAGQALLERPGVEGWELVRTCFSSITPASGERFTVADEIRSATSHKIVMRWFDGLTTRHRLSFRSRVFYVLAVLNEGERNVRYTLLCKELV